MKKTLHVITFFLVCSFQTVFGQIPNAGFENWSTGHLGRLEPDGWITNDSLYTVATLVQDAGHGASGYSAKFIITYDAVSGYYQGGVADLTHLHFTGVNRPTSITGYWKSVLPNVNDFFEVEVRMYNAANSQISHVWILAPDGSNPNWSSFSLPLSYSNGDPVDNYSIEIYLGTFINSAAAYASIDELAFDFSTGVNGPAPDVEPYSIGTLGNNLFQLIKNNSPERNVNVEILDLNGRLIKNFGDHDFDKSDRLAIDLSALGRGIYFCKITDAEIRKLIRVTVQ